MTKTVGQKSKIHREIGPVGLLFISFTAIFGSGWLFAPFFAAQVAGPQSILAWVIGVAISAVVGVTMAEVVTLFPKVGGLNTLVQMTHGRLISFLMTFLTLVVFIILPVLEVRAILQYLSVHSSSLADAHQNFTFLGYLSAGLLLIIINLVNLWGARTTSHITGFTVLFKLIAPLVICFSFLATIQSQGHLSLENLLPFFPIRWDEVFTAISTCGIIFSFNGFNQATFFAAEAKDPQKSIPFAILGSLFCTAILYLIIQTIFLISLPSDLIAQGWSKLSFPGENGPFAGLAVLLGLGSLVYFIYVDAIFSPLGTAYTYASAAPRMLYAMAENSGFLPVLKRLNSRGVPSHAVLLSTAIGFLVFVALPSLKAMISMLVAAFVMCYTAAPVCLLVFRKTDPHAPRTFRIALPRTMAFLSLYLSNLMVFSCGWTSVKVLSASIIVATALSVLLFLKGATRFSKELMGASWFLLQSIGIAGATYFHSVGKIGFLGACLVLAAVSAFILWFSQFVSLRKIKI